MERRGSEPSGGGESKLIQRTLRKEEEEKEEEKEEENKWAENVTNENNFTKIGQKWTVRPK